MKVLIVYLLTNGLILALILLAALMLLWSLGRGSLEDFDEAIYAQISKEIILAKKDLKSLSSVYEITVVTEVEPFAYATIKSRAGR